MEKIMNREICIYCAGVRGVRLYLYMKEHGINISFFGDVSPERHGLIVDGVLCRSYESIIGGNKDIIIIVANAKPQSIITSFKKHGFKYVFTDDEAINCFIDVNKNNCNIGNITKIEEIRRVKMDLLKLFAHLKNKYRSVAPNNGKLKILQINYTDLPGHVFDGYDLMNDLNRLLGYDVKQIVARKVSDSNTVIPILDNYIARTCVDFYETKFGVSNLFPLTGDFIYKMNEYQEADLVHYHILHNRFISLLDYSLLMNSKLSVWTIHDPWLVTGDCIHPLQCDGWLEGCLHCHNVKVGGTVSHGQEKFMWNLKKEVLRTVNPHIVVASSFMRKYLQQSPMTKHFQNIYEIPFGIKPNRFNLHNNAKRKQEMGIPADMITVGFRVTDYYVKGCTYIYEALRSLDFNEKIFLLVVGEGKLAPDIKCKYKYKEFGWLNDEQKLASFMEGCDIFLMPSLAESFGVMAIEAMAAGCTVICFKNTVLEEITNSPHCGIAVNYKSSSEIARVLYELIHDTQIIAQRGRYSSAYVNKMYSYDDYVNKHKQLYEHLIQLQQNNKV